MNKALSKYGKSKWQHVRLSKPSKIRKAIAFSQVAMIKAQALSQIEAIKSSGDKSDRAIWAMGRIMLNAADACNSVMRAAK
ncbi:DNA polymerase [Alteromonas phage XX1924]|nr:DNA polymerase [Alteromonas phage XX1924]